MAEIAVNWNSTKSYKTLDNMLRALKKNQIPDTWRYVVVSNLKDHRITPVFMVDNIHMPEMLRVVHCGYMLVGG